MEQKKEALLHSLYSICQDRSLTSREVLSKLVANIQIAMPKEKEDSLLEIIRNYKNTGKNLEFTVNSLYDIFYPKTNSYFGDRSQWDRDE